MEPGDAILLAVVGVLASNQLVARLPGWAGLAPVFWVMQAFNVGAAIYVMALGIPGLDGNLKIFNWVFGLLFIVRIVQNNQRYGAARRDARKGSATDERARKERIRAALQAGEADADTKSSPDEPSTAE